MLLAKRAISHFELLLSIDPMKETKFVFFHLSDFGSGNPFLVHTILGVGDPLAEHLSDTGGPGWRVWSMNR